MMPKGDDDDNDDNDGTDRDYCRTEHYNDILRTDNAATDDRWGRRSQLFRLKEGESYMLL